MLLQPFEGVSSMEENFLIRFLPVSRGCEMKYLMVEKRILRTFVRALCIRFQEISHAHTDTRTHRDTDTHRHIAHEPAEKVTRGKKVTRNFKKKKKKKEKLRAK